MSDRERRVGQNEAVFRQVNEQIEGINRAFEESAPTMEVVCECGNLRCFERIPVDVPAYERVRADSALFIVVPGHEIPDVEDVVERNDGWVVVRKHPGEPERIAAETDPRA